MAPDNLCYLFYFFSSCGWMLPGKQSAPPPVGFASLVIKHHLGLLHLSSDSDMRGVEGAGLNESLRSFHLERSACITLSSHTLSILLKI